MVVKLILPNVIISEMLEINPTTVQHTVLGSTVDTKEDAPTPHGQLSYIHTHGNGYTAILICMSRGI